jgi:hypothetical protein
MRTLLLWLLIQPFVAIAVGKFIRAGSGGE